MSAKSRAGSIEPHLTARMPHRWRVLRGRSGAYGVYKIINAAAPVRDPLHSVNTFVDEGMAFLDRHPDLRENDTLSSIGGLYWGLLRSLMECDFCPGHFRFPVAWEKVSNTPGDFIYCPNCQRLWEHKG